MSNMFDSSGNLVLPRDTEEVFAEYHRKLPKNKTGIWVTCPGCGHEWERISTKAEVRCRRCRKRFSLEATNRPRHSRKGRAGMRHENRIMHALRVGPAMIERLEGKIDLDRDELRRIRNDLASEMEPTGFLRMRERALVRRIESSTERLHQLQAEVSATREKIAGVTS